MTDATRILPLPEDVVLQIKSSTAITSLTQVVLELLSNSLDAKATKVSVNIDFARGACTVEDDGQGILPAEFEEDGGLGKLYCTSKYHSRQDLFGCNGYFLASLSTVSLLSITSRHHHHRSNNAVTFHHGKVLERQLPVRTIHELDGRHGTRVIVRNLFGNLPVRVKQRLVYIEQKSEQDRLWEVLKRDVIGLLLSSKRYLSLRVRDGDNKIVFSLDTSHASVAKFGEHKSLSKPPSSSHTYLLNLLTQANLISHDAWPQWVPVSVSTVAISIKGAISLSPAPSKRVQFISLGKETFSAQGGHNEFHDEVNRVFSLSIFGSAEDTGTEGLQVRGSKSSSNPSNEISRVRKDVDRYPMFHFRISLKKEPDLVQTSQLFDDRNTVQKVLEVLRAMISEWLSVHHFRPRKPTTKRQRVDEPHAIIPKLSMEGQHTLETVLDSDVASEKQPPRSFADWSRIKSGNRSALHFAVPHLRSSHQAVTKHSNGTVGCALSCSCSSLQENNNIFHVDAVPQGALDGQATHPETSLHQDGSLKDDCAQGDETILWRDPANHRLHVLNARTGCAISVPRYGWKSSGSNEAWTGTMPRDLEQRRSTAPPPWLHKILNEWENPVFMPGEQPIPQTLFRRYEDRAESRGIPRSSLNLGSVFNQPTTAASDRVSKENLMAAEVIAQVDKKFILVKVKSLDEKQAREELNDLLILIDQHAADERIQVEALLKELCTTANPSDHSLSYQSKLGHVAQVSSLVLDKPIHFSVSRPDSEQFTIYAARLAAWGILYDVFDPLTTLTSASQPAKECYLISVTSLPPGISERCKMDPAVLISFLRQAVWQYANDPHLSSSILDHSNLGSTDWVRRLATCPQGLVDLINSRACRSAIMFNDDLTLAQCKDVVVNLSRCTFPFMCAHGRPSMVPLIRVESLGRTVEGHGDSDGNGEKSTFVQAWRRWKG